MRAALPDALAGGLVDAIPGAEDPDVSISSNLSFLRPARFGPIRGCGRLERPGRAIAHVRAERLRGEAPIATASAICRAVGVATTHKEPS